MNATQNFKWQLTYRNDKVVEFLDEYGNHEEYPPTYKGRCFLEGLLLNLREEAQYECFECPDPDGFFEGECED